LGETQNLLKLIDTFITQDVYDKILKDNLDFGVVVTSLTKNRALIKTASENSFEDMKEWMWASANEPVFMTALYKDGEAWVDGGLKDYLPITYSIDKGFSDVDVIIHNAEDYTSKDWIQSGGIFGLLLRTLAIYGADVEVSNLTVAQLRTQLKDVKEENLKLNLYFMSQDQFERTENELIFDNTIMKDLLSEGYDSVVKGTVVKKSYP
jgi:NTE family protein